jgi:predicted metal-dependent HD superfamily phosphohydrolase
MNKLKETYISLLTSYTNDTLLIHKCWDEIEINYTATTRYYHTLEHLNNLVSQLTEVKNNITNWDAILFSLYYHDIIYNSQQKDNEEKSAEFAKMHMLQLQVPIEIIEYCITVILATKSHTTSIDNSTNYFLDADLSILGLSWHLYQAYFKNIRSEYAIYPDDMYTEGRKKVLQFFLKMERIYKTDYFYNKFEITAKKNLQNEFKLLNT